MAETPFEILPIDVDLASFDAVIDIGTDVSLPRPFPDAAVATFDELTIDPNRFVDASDRILVVCDRGVTSRTAAIALHSQGFTRAVSLVGGAQGADGLGGSASRYDRQIRLAGFGIDGQNAIERATITVVGAGGLGCPALAVLAPAGVGTIRIVDFDTIDQSNLHRQPLFTPGDVGAPKVKVAAERLRKLNPDVTIDAIETLITPDNAESLLADSDVVIDATDTFSARAAITQACAATGTPMVYGSIYGFEGQFAVFNPPDGPCYRCVFPSSPTPGTAIDCSTIGTLGAVTAVIGALEGSAAVQLAAGIGSGLTGILTMFDARTSSFDRLPIARAHNCLVCGSLA